MSSFDIKNYLNNSSPLSRLQNSNKIPLRQIHNSVDLKLTLMNDHPKNFETPKNKLKRSKLFSSASNCSKDLEMHQYSQMKASSIIYNIPQLSPPEINFQISNKLRHKINEIKQDIVTKLPIIKSSQFSTSKLESLFSRRTVLKDLQDWLQQKLKNPPLTHEDSIEYKNMIMGVGMKQVIRLIGTRCAQEANIVNEIWQLTWSICREIILHLSKRAHKCQKILEQQATFFRNGCETRIKDSQTAVKLFKQQNAILKQRSDKLAADLAKVKKKNKELKLTKLNLQGVNNQLKDQFQITFKQNLLLHLKMAPNDHQRRLWVKRKYASLINSSKKNNVLFKKFLDSVLTQNNYQLNEQQVSQIQLTTDLNKFKLEQNKRKFDVQQQLQDRFKTYTQQTQTIVTQKEDTAVETLRIATTSIQVETDAKEKEEIGINTQFNNEIGTNSKNKSKKITTKKSVAGSIDKDKKKDDTKLKLKQKMSMNIQTIKDQQTGDQNDKQETLKTENRQQKPVINVFESVYLKDSQSIQNGLKQFNKKQLHQENIKQQIHSEEISKQNSKQNILKKSISQYEQIKESGENIDGQIIHEQLQQNINKSNEEYKGNHQQIRLKQQKIEQLRSLILEIEKKHNTQLENINEQLNSKKLTILSLNKKIMYLSQQMKIQKQRIKQNVQISPTDRIMEDEEYQELIQLLKKKRYKQLIKQIKIKASIQGSELQNSCLQSNLNKLNSNQITKENQIKCLSKNKLLLQYQYQKKNSNANGNGNGSQIQKKTSLHSNYDFGIQNEMTEEVRQKRVESIQSIKNSRRSSNKSINGMKFNINKYSVQNNQHQSQPKISLNNLTFVEACTRYFYQSSSFITQSNGNGTKQPGINDYSKRIIKDQYREIYKQVMEGQHGERNQKQMRTVIDKAINSLLKQLCKDIQTAQKQELEKIQQVKINYSPMPILMANRFNMNFGVKKVASKHIKDLLICLKGIKKHTQKYSVISYFMLYSPSLSTSNSILDYQDSQLLFFYILLITIMQGIHADHNISQDEIDTITQLARKYLTSDEKFISNVQNLSEVMKAQNNNTFIKMFKKIITLYKNLYLQRTSQMEMIYSALSKQVKQGKWGIKWEDFVDFISVFNIKASMEDDECLSLKSWHSIVLKTMIQVMIDDKTSQNGIISQECFVKFIVKCPQFNLTQIKDNIQSIIQLEKVDLSLQNTQKQILAMCQQHSLLQSVAKFLFQSENLGQQAILFWVGYIKLYILESQTNSIIGSLLNGVLDPKISPVILKSLSISSNEI